MCDKIDKCKFCKSSNLERMLIDGKPLYTNGKFSIPVYLWLCVDCGKITRTTDGDSK